MKILSSHIFPKFLYFENWSSQREETELVSWEEERSWENETKKRIILTSRRSNILRRFPLLLKGERLSN